MIDDFVGVRFIAPKRDERDWSSFAVCYQPVLPPPPTPDVIEVPVAETLPIIETPDEYQRHPEELQALITVQHALVNFCAARADVVGMLSLPLHFKRREVLDWREILIVSALSFPSFSAARRLRCTLPSRGPG